MWKRKGTLLLIVLGLLAVGLLWITSRKPEPTYEGHSLSYWVLRDDAYHERSGERRQAEQAIRHIGTNALPFLLKWVQNERPAWRSEAIDFARRLPTWTLANWMERNQSETFANNSSGALSALGEQATPILPELLRLLANSPTMSSTALRISSVLPAIGTNALPALISAIEDPAFSANRGYVLMAIRDIHPPPAAAAAAVPVLIHCLSESNLPHMAADTLGSLGAAPDRAVPALMACLQSPNQELRWASVEALGNFGTNSLAAVPALIHCLHYGNSEVASEAAKTLGKIGLEPNLVIPALASAIQRDDAGISISAVIALGTFGAQATNEVPLLTGLLSDPVWQVRIQASKAIEHITGRAPTNPPAQ
ncbi:MAG: HEAT repeat domain-containing protein [Verrucomicrobiia bacterium]|jgi:HEAT repeat protein